MENKVNKNKNVVFNEIKCGVGHFDIHFLYCIHANMHFYISTIFILTDRSINTKTNPNHFPKKVEFIRQFMTLIDCLLRVL